MKPSSCRDLKLEIFANALEQYGEQTVFAHRTGDRQKSLVHRRRPGFLALGVARPTGRGRSVRLAVRVTKGRGNYQRALKLLKQAGVREKEYHLVSGVDCKAQSLILRIAVSGAHAALCRGTLGAVVQDDRQIYVLSCNHVLTNTQTARPHDPIIQPSRCDAVQLLPVGRLDWWEPLETARADVALAAIDGSAVTKINALEIVKGNHAINMDPRPIEDRQSVKRVFKCGARTGFSRGKVRAHDLDNVPVTYRRPDGSTFRVTFDNQIEIVHRSPGRKFSDRGDSGALVFDDATNRPFGLLFSGFKGNDGVHATLANFLPDVLKVAEVQLVQEEHPDPPNAVSRLMDRMR